MLENNGRNNEFDENRDENIKNEEYREEIFEESDLITPNMETEQDTQNAETAYSESEEVKTENEDNPKYSYSAPGMQGTPMYPGKENKKHKKSMNLYVKVLCCAVLFGAVSGGMVLGSFAIGNNVIQAGTAIETTATRLSTSTSGNSEEGGDSSANGTEYSVSQISKQCKSSVVAITNQSISEVQTMFGVLQKENTGSGSGVIIGKNETELLIATNNHVVSGAESLTVCFNDSKDAVFDAKIKGADAENDLAVIAINLSDISEDVLNSISIATIGDSDSLEVGDEVVAIGNALGFGQSVTSGIVSAVDREVTIDDSTATLLQTDAAINPGNSGGALFNMKGELIGINTAKYASEQIEGMGFAIPMAKAQGIIENLMNRETRDKLDSDYGYLSITGQDVSEEATQMYGIPQGAYVVSVSDGGAAANAGIRQGDIITGLDGNTISSISDLKEQLQYYKAGEQVEVTLQRNSENGYEEQTVTVTLDNASEQQSTTQNSQNIQEGQIDSGDEGAQNVPNYGNEYNNNPFEIR